MTGRRATADCRFTRWKAGVSCSRRRMNSPRPTSSALARNGIRQPQARNSASGRKPHSAKAPIDAMTPRG